ncbi:hypothetical protein [Guyparkeria sp.]|uniref:hypothetical protein n=1 Tax=Guyparkeria sp. TaxID=2035736 RepID=UPI0039705398
MHTYADEVIEFWANVFRACRLSGTGLDLEEFLESPREHLDHLGLSDALEMLASGHLPLLPEQAAVRREIDARFPLLTIPERSSPASRPPLGPPAFLAAAT